MALYYGPPTLGDDDLGFGIPKFIKKAVDPREHIKLAAKGLKAGHNVGVSLAKTTTGIAKDAVMGAVGTTMGLFGGKGGGAAARPPCGFFDNIMKIFGDRDCD
jgi:hypothetical protein